MILSGNEVSIVHKDKILDLTDDQSYIVIVADDIKEVITKFMTKYNRMPSVVFAIDNKPGTHLLPVTDAEVKKSKGNTIKFVTNKDQLE